MILTHRERETIFTTWLSNVETRMTYLVATDGTAEGTAAVEYCAHHAAAMDESLEIVHVATPETRLERGRFVLEDDETNVSAAEELLSAARETAESTAGEDIPVETTLLAGVPATEIVTHAAETGASAIYVGHRTLSADHQRVVGSVAKTVLEKATVPVTVVR